MLPPTNQEIAARLGVHHSLVSRLRSGDRLPGPMLIEKISQEFEIPLATLLRTRNRGCEEFGALFRRRIFQDLPPRSTIHSAA